MLPIRRLLIDLSQGFERYWCNGDAFKTAYFNALSMSFPLGEQFFIDAVKRVHKEMPAEKAAAFDDAVKGFAGQEATHRHLHALYNQELTRQGFINHWEVRAKERLTYVASLSSLHGLAMTAALEHYTSVFGDWILRHPETFGDPNSMMSKLWLWHASEETEHKSIAFDLYEAAGGDHARRVRWFKIVTINFSMNVVRQTCNNLWHSGDWHKPRTWVSAYQTLIGKNGVIRQSFPALRAYLKPDFHPNQLGEASVQNRWLLANQQAYKVVNQASIAG